MTIRTEFDLNHESYDMTVVKLSEKLVEVHGNSRKAQTYIYELNGMPENPDLWDLMHEAECHLLLQNFKDIVNKEDRTYKSGDLWILEDAVEIREKIIEDVYNELERQDNE